MHQQEPAPVKPSYCIGCNVYFQMKKIALRNGAVEWVPDCVHAAACKRMHDRWIGIVDGEMK